MADVDVEAFLVKMTAEASEANQKLEPYLTAIAVRAKHKSAEEKKRRLSDEEREKIDSFLGPLNGNIAELSTSDILAGAGVSKKQGTSSYAAGRKRVLLLAHQPA